LDHQSQPLPGVQFVRIGIFTQWAATNDFHGKVRLGAESGISGSSLVDLRDAGVMEAAERLELPLEAAEDFRAGPGCFDDLQCDATAGLVLLSLVHRSHSTLAQQANDPIASDTGRQIGPGSRRLWIRGRLWTQRRKRCVRIVSMRT